MTDVIFGPIFDVVTAFAVPGGGVLIVGGGVVAAPRVAGVFRQRAYNRATALERRRWMLRLDPSGLAGPDAARRLVAALHPGGKRGVSRWASGWPQLTLRVAWADGRARWEIEAPSQLARAVEIAVAAAYPGAELEEAAPAADMSDGSRLGIRGSPPPDERHPVADFGSVLAELLTRAPSNARAAWTLRITPQSATTNAVSEDSIGWLEMFLDSFLNRPPRRPATAATPRTPRPAGPSFTVLATMEIASSSAGAMRAWLFDAMAVFGTLRASGWSIEATVGGRSVSMQLDASDVADLWGLTAAGSDARAVDVIRSRRVPAPARAKQADGMRPIGLDAGRAVLVPDNLFARHAILLGRTGSGKSTELVALAADDLQAGRGFTFIDPHGDAVARLLDAVPPDQADRVHLLELADKDRPRGFNPIELDGADPELVAAQFVDTMRAIYFAHLSAPAHRQEQYLRSALMTLLSRTPGPAGPWTLEALNRLFIDPDFREEITYDLDDPILAAFWKHQWSQRRGAPDPSADALISKLAAFLSYPSIRAIVSAPRSTIRPRRIMDRGEVLLVDLSRAGGDNAWMFGGLVIGRYYVDALGRQEIPPAARVPHTLYVDEVQNFNTSALRSTTAEGRKFALRLVMATQYLESLGRDLQRAIRANVATTALLQPAPEDARTLRDEFAPMTERDLVNLPRFRMAVRTELDGEASVFTADVLGQPTSLGSAQLVRQRSDERDARDGRATAE
jgi:hypothetical protein